MYARAKAVAPNTTTIVAGVYGVDLARYKNENERGSDQDALEATLLKLNSDLHYFNIANGTCSIRIDKLIHKNLSKNKTGKGLGKSHTNTWLTDGYQSDNIFLEKVAKLLAKIL